MTLKRLPHLSDDTWTTLADHAARLAATPVRELFASDSNRYPTLTLEAEGLVVDCSRQRLDGAVLAALVRAAQEAGLPAAIDAMFTGALVNNTERRPALHTALRDRSDTPLMAEGQDVRAAVRRERERLRAFVADVHEGRLRGATGERFTDVINIGIGGSDLGPVMAVEALKSYADPRVNVHFVSNVDGCQLKDLAAVLDPARTLVLVCSKTFTTLETLTNARLARRFIAEPLGEAAVARHFAAVSVNQPAMDEFGVSPTARFEMWDWVGGRYSLWSAIGLAIELAIGSARFEEFLAGGNAIDRHFRSAPLSENLPARLGLVAVWNRNFLDCDTQVVLPYDQRLHRFPAYLQQLTMESNGKRVRRDGTPVGWDTGPVYWGEPGSNSQHSFFQLLHQGTVRAALDFLLPARSSVGDADGQALAGANCLAQAEAFMRGYSLAEARAELEAKHLDAARIAALAPHKVHPGDRPSTIILFQRTDPATLGKLVALYEHSVYVQSVLWDINPFDQWGVELGKRLAESLIPAVRGERPITYTSGVADLIRRLIAWR
jgi:glucose-6-phosphate isomerase